MITQVTCCDSGNKLEVASREHFRYIFVAITTKGREKVTVQADADELLQSVKAHAAIVKKRKE